MADNKNFFPPKEITIREDGESKDFTTSGLKTSSEKRQTRWIPKSDIECVNARLYSAGTYSPYPYYGFASVYVGGGSDSSDATQGSQSPTPSTRNGSMIVGKDPETGRLTRITLVEENGEKVLKYEDLGEKPIPSGIVVYVQPSKTRYKDGEEIDYSGMEIALVDDKGIRVKNEDYPEGSIRWVPPQLIQRPEYDTLVTSDTTATYSGEQGAGQSLQRCTVGWTSPYDGETYEALAYIVVEEATE